jgi:hypothetical protein
MHWTRSAVGTTHVPEWRSRVTPAAYLGVLLSARVVYDLGQTLATGMGDASAWQPGSVLLALSMVAAVLLWSMCRGVSGWRPSERVWFGLVLALWLYLVVLETVGGVPIQAASVFIPLSILLLWVKRPSSKDAWQAADAFAWVVVGSAAVVLVLEATGLIPSWYEQMRDASPAFATLSEFDRDTHWLPLGGVLGLEGRWGGFMGDPNLIGPLAALLVVYAFARVGARRLTFATAGVIMLVLADSRASYGAAAVGLLALIVLPGWGVPLRSMTPPKMAAGLVGLAALARVAADTVQSPGAALSMTGRTGMWPDFLDLWRESPVVGVGTARIVEAVALGQVPPWSFHGHNQYIDTLVRYGLIGLLLSALVLGAALLLTVQGARRGLGLGVALMVTLAVITLANIAFDWRLPGSAFSILLVAVVLSATQARPPVPDARPSPT